jgi:hypothetical protein
MVTPYLKLEGDDSTWEGAYPQAVLNVGFLAAQAKYVRKSESFPV